MVDGVDDGRMRTDDPILSIFCGYYIIIINTTSKTRAEVKCIYIGINKHYTYTYKYIICIQMNTYSKY